MVSPKTDYTVWRFWFDVGQYVIAFMIAFYVWVSNRAKATDKDMKKVAKTMGGIETRVTKLESGSLSHDDLGAVYDRVNGIAEQVSNLDGKMDGVRGAVDMINEHLLSNGGRK